MREAPPDVFTSFGVNEGFTGEQPGATTENSNPSNPRSSNPMSFPWLLPYPRSSNPMRFPWLLPYKPFIHTPEMSLSTKRCGTLWKPDPVSASAVCPFCAFCILRAAAARVQGPDLPSSSFISASAFWGPRAPARHRRSHRYVSVGSAKRTTADCTKRTTARGPTEQSQTSSSSTTIYHPVTSAHDKIDRAVGRGGSTSHAPLRGSKASRAVHPQRKYAPSAAPPAA